MVTELEKQFFSTFGIEPKPLFSTRNGYTDDAYLYPQITDTHYLKMIVFLSGEDWYELGYKDLIYAKKRILDIFISNSYQEEKKDFIQALFKEER